MNSIARRMRRTRRLFVLMGLAVGVGLALVVPVGAGGPLISIAQAHASAGKPTVTHISFREQTAEAEFAQEVNHVYTYVYVLADAIDFHAPPGPPERAVPGVYLLIEQYDTQTGMGLLFASGEASPVDLRFGAQLRWATLRATVPVTDEESGRSLTITVQIQWQAGGPLERIHTNDHHHSPGLTTTSHFLGLRRLSSTASGTMAGWAGQTLPPAVWTNLESAKSGAVDISHAA